MLISTTTDLAELARLRRVLLASRWQLAQLAAASEAPTPPPEEIARIEAALGARVDSLELLARKLKKERDELRRQNDRRLAALAEVQRLVQAHTVDWAAVLEALRKGLAP